MHRIRDWRVAEFHERCMHCRWPILVTYLVVTFDDGAPAQTVQVRARTHRAAATFVADGSDGDLLFCFYRTVARHERQLCHLTTRAAFAGIFRVTPLATFGENLSNSWCAKKASQYHALSAHGGFPNQAAL
jgi:hypothetical protein